MLADLSHNALLHISGDDARAFLHGQFTNDVEALAAGQAQWSGWCTAKGRLLATFLLARIADGYLMLLPAEIAPAIARRLGMFVLRSKVRIRDASGEFGRYAAIGPQADSIAEALRTPSIVAARLAPHLAVVLGPASELRDAVADPVTGTEAREAWDRALVQAGIPMIVAATQEAFVPQMANFDLVGGVSFRKGCYPGQEIVARTQYRGILKRRMARARVGAAAGDPPAPGQSIYSPAFGDQAAGTVVSAVPDAGGGHELLVVAQVESLREGGIRLGSPDGTPIEILEHPPLETAAR